MNYSFVATCFNRHIELDKMIASFIKYADILPSQWIFSDDTGDSANSINHIVKKYDLKNCRVVKNYRNIGQLASIDISYSLVEFDYIFHSEEDWEFVDGGFIKESFDLLNNNDDLVTVWLRSVNDTNTHPLHVCDYRDISIMSLRHGKDGKWNGFTLNPGLRRLIDYKSVAPFSEYRDERDLSHIHYWLGFRAAHIGGEHGFVRHIGHDSTYGRKWTVNKCS